MPIKRVDYHGKVCYKFGNKGKLYCGKGALEKATRQGRAIKASQYRKYG